MEDIQKVADALTAILRLIVDKPDEMSLTIVPDGSDWMFRVSVFPSDVGMLIGKQGRIARSLRTVLIATSMKTKQKIRLDISSDQRFQELADS
jgi:predicted RNA-binding protein YlqC (UPF0109 family)